MKAARRFFWDIRGQSKNHQYRPDHALVADQRLSFSKSIT